MCLRSSSRDTDMLSLESPEPARSEIGEGHNRGGLPCHSREGTLSEEESWGARAPAE